MKKVFLLTFVLVSLSVSILGTGLTITVSGSTTHHVYPSESIQNAINSAYPGDTIFVHSGTWYEEITIDKDDLVLLGEDKATIIDGEGMITPVFWITANNVTVKGFTMRDGGRIYGLFGGGIYMTGSNCTVVDNLITNTQYGINLNGSARNIIAGNSITANDVGIQFLDGQSNNSTIYHNNFINNSWHQVQSFAVSNNTWDNGFEGNYWSNYTGVDLDHDGIGDTENVIDEYNEDRFPLMGIFHSFNTTLAKYVNVISDSTVEDFTFFDSNNTIMMYASNMTTNQTYGFCRACIPKDLIAPPYNVKINDGSVEVLYFNDTIHDNGTHRWIYFSHEHPTLEITIVPEFPKWPSIIFVLTLVTVTIVIYKRRLLKTSIY